MNKRHNSRESGSDINALNRLFGCDLAVGGWVVEDRSGRPVRAEKPVSEKRRRIAAPDPSMIWALRGRRR
jgi:hypothetical protein